MHEKIVQHFSFDKYLNLRYFGKPISLSLGKCKILNGLSCYKEKYYIDIEIASEQLIDFFENLENEIIQRLNINKSQFKSILKNNCLYIDGTEIKRNPSIKCVVKLNKSIEKDLKYCCNVLSTDNKYLTVFDLISGIDGIFQVMVFKVWKFINEETSEISYGLTTILTNALMC